MNKNIAISAIFVFSILGGLFFYKEFWKPRQSLDDSSKGNIIVTIDQQTKINLRAIDVSGRLINRGSEELIVPKVKVEITNEMGKVIGQSNALTSGHVSGSLPPNHTANYSASVVIQENEKPRMVTVIAGDYKAAIEDLK